MNNLLWNTKFSIPNVKIVSNYKYKQTIFNQTWEKIAFKIIKVDKWEQFDEKL